jgi:hypothetical protein
MQKMIDTSDSSTTLTLEVINDAPLRAEFLPATGTPSGRIDGPRQASQKKADTPSSSTKPKKRQESAAEGQPKMTLHLERRQSNTEAKPPTKPAPQSCQAARATKKGPKTKPGVTPVSITPDDEKSSTASSSGSADSDESTTNSGGSRPSQGTTNKIDVNDF